MELRRPQASDAPALTRVQVDSWQAAHRGLVPDSSLEGFTHLDGKSKTIDLGSPLKAVRYRKTPPDRDFCGAGGEQGRELMPMPVYMIVDIKVKDPGPYSEYVERVPEILARYGGRYLVRGGQVTPLSGNWSPERIVVIEFESLEQLQRCFESAEYRAIAHLREESTVGRAVIVEGCLPSD